MTPCIEAGLGELLRRHLKNKGYTAVGEIGILINKSPLRIRAADVVYISKEKSPEEPKGILEIPPDLIIEIISESNTAWEMTDKGEHKVRPYRRLNNSNCRGESCIRPPYVHPRGTPNNSIGKVKDYLSMGVGRIILIDPLTQTVSLYQKGKKEALLYNFDEEVILIEGLSVKMKELLS